MSAYFPSSTSSGESATVSCAEPQLLPNNMMMYMNYPSSFEAYSNEQARNSTAQEPDQFNAWKDDRNDAILIQNTAAEHSSLQGQGLSLSLATEIPSGFQLPSAEYRVLNPAVGFSFMGHINNQEKDNSDMNLEEPQRLDCYAQYEVANIYKVVPKSKYLKATQQLLDEVVNVKQALKKTNTGKDENEFSPAEGETSGKNADEITPIERQSCQSKLTQLLTMLDKIDRKYKQYYHEMQIVVSSFDTVAGSGAATPYTAVALRTISCHFRSLRDAITGQIHATRRNLGESDASSSEKGVGISRLRYVDQRKTLHQLGIMQHHAWRPQRGLPESSVLVLRSWLFEHFLHPYPKDSEKIMLARQAGLTRSQVSNWFINARVRLWKPMVEEMYKEEIDFGNIEMDPNTQPGNGSESPNSNNKAASSKSNISHSSNIGDVQDMEMTGPIAHEFQSDDLRREALRRYEPENFGIVGPTSGNAVSLTLALEGIQQQQFVGMRGDEMFGSLASPMDPGNQVNGFLAFSTSSHKLQ